ncbi:MAG: hypothetical protein CMJ78_14450 [Planctomycetaceae bacterium]|nr:hypothetical protein [Planctomycetaceae bacterium]
MLVILAVSSRSAQAQPPTNPANPNWQFGFELFHLLLEQKGLKTTTDTEAAFTDDPRRTVVVLLGNQNYMPFRTTTNLHNYLKRGGALLIASDRRARFSGMCEIQSGPITVPDAFAYRGYADCPDVRNLNSNHPLMRDVKQVIANRCGAIKNTSSRLGRWTLAASFPGGSRRSGQAITGSLVATLKPRDSVYSRVAVVADHSLFINGMLWHGDNAVFALNVADWLCSTRRKTLLFVVDGKPLASGMPMPNELPEDATIPPNLPPELPELPEELPEEIPDVDLSQVPEDSWLAFGNNFLTGMEDADIFNELAADRPRDMEEWLYRRNLLLLLGMLAGLFLILQLARSGRRMDRPMVRSGSPTSQTQIARSANNGDYQPACRELARAMFRRLTGADEPSGWVMRERDICVDGSRSFARSIQLRIKRLEKIARNLNRQRVSRRQFQSIAKEIEEIYELHEQGLLSHDRIVPA